MRPPSPNRVLSILEQLNWQGHVELPTIDMQWLALQIAAHLDERRDLCGSCGTLGEIIVQTRLGPLCEACLEEAQENAEIIRESLEGR